MSILKDDALSNLQVGNAVISKNLVVAGDILTTGNILTTKNLDVAGNISTNKNLDVAGNVNGFPYPNSVTTLNGVIDKPFQADFKYCTWGNTSSNAAALTSPILIPFECEIVALTVTFEHNSPINITGVSVKTLIRNRRV